MLNCSNTTLMQAPMKKIILLSSCLPILLSTGCTGLNGTQPPAPVYSSLRPYNAPVQPIASSPVAVAPSKVDDVVQVQTIQDYTPVIEPIDKHIEPIEQPLTAIKSNVNTSVDGAIHSADSGISKIIEVQAPSRPLLMPTPPQTTGIIPKFETPTPPPAPAEFKPAESTTSMSPAVSALLATANQNTKAGDMESAAAAIERAIRIEPRNGELFYKLAVLRLKQSKPVLAEDLAKKSALLAGKDNTLKKNSWLLIAHAKEMQGDTTGATEAESKAAGF